MLWPLAVIYALLSGGVRYFVRVPTADEALITVAAAVSITLMVSPPDADHQGVMAVGSDRQSPEFAAQGKGTIDLKDDVDGVYRPSRGS